MENKHFVKAIEKLQENSIEISEYELTLLLALAETSRKTSLKEIWYELEKLHSMLEEKDFLYFTIEILLEKLKTIVTI